MTTIAACTLNGVHAIAADGQHGWPCGGIAGGKVEKLCTNGTAVIAGAGDLRVINLMSSLPDCPTVEDFVSVMKSIVEKDGFVAKEGYGAKDYGSPFFFMSDQGIWEICPAFSYSQVEDTMPSASGTGWALAVGAMEVLCKGDYGLALSASEVVAKAVRVAIKRDSYTGGGIMLAARGRETFGPEWI